MGDNMDDERYDNKEQQYDPDEHEEVKTLEDLVEEDTDDETSEEEEA